MKRRKQAATQVAHAVRTGADCAGMRACFRAAALAFAAMAMVSPMHPAAAATYKWVDERGIVHYSDKLPPDAVDKASVELNKEGVSIRRTDKSLSPEQRRALEQDAERQRQSERARELIARRDRALVASYTTEAEIDLARNRSLQTINSAVQSSQAYSEQLIKRKADVEIKKAEAKGKTVTSVLDRELESIEAELARQADLVAQKKRETAALIAKYDADKLRWRELVAAKAAADPANSASVTPGDITPLPAAAGKK